MKSKLRKVTAVLLVVVMTLCALCVGTVSAGAAEDIENIEVTLPDVRTELEGRVSFLDVMDLFPAEYWYEYYEKEAFDSYVAVLEKAKALLADSKATDAQLDAMLDEVYMVESVLMASVKLRKVLESMVENSSMITDMPIEELYEAYGQESVDTYLAAVEKAKALLADENATDEELKAMIEELQAAEENLFPTYDARTELEMMVEYASWIDEEPIESLYEEYGQENVDAYIAAVEKAKALLADENATDEELQAMIEELQAAEENLYMNYDPCTELMELLESLSYYFDQEPEYWYEIYTKESYDALLAAKEKAEMLLADENANDDQFLEVIDELNMAESNLVYLNGPSFSGGKIYWECPWSNVKAAYCHVFSSYGNWLYDWQTQYEKMTNEGGNLWSYEIPEGPYDLVIFSIDTGAQTYELVLTDENVGDTAITDTSVMVESPIDENKTSAKTTWKSGVNGAHLTITSTGNIVGDKLCPTESGADAVAYFIGIYLPIQPLYVTSEVLKNAMNKFGTNQAEIVDVLEREFAEETEYIDEAKTLLGYVEGVLGDVTGDGEVKLTDAINIQKASLSMKSLTAKTTVTGDVNGDGKISVIDAILVQKMSLGMIA
ncbi:MAG: dockerin type I domain-containing protein [Acutalibacteraceae bacterium]